MTKCVPYDELDQNILSLVKALNAFDGITTVGSCGGHQNANVRYQNEEGTWYVSFDADHTEDGWFALEFIAWVVRDWGRGGHNGTLEATSLPPYLNEPGSCLRFVLEGWGHEVPDELAKFIDDLREEFYISPTEVD